MSKNTPERRAARKARAEQALREKRAAERRRRLLTIGAVVAAVVLIIGGLTWWQTTRDTTGDAADEVPTVATAGVPTDGTAGTVDGFGIVVGDPEAPTTVTLYEDMQCPACANLESELGPAISDAIDSGAIRVDYRLVSFLDDASTNDYSSRAFNAALAVLDTAGVDAFRTFHDDLYADQPEEGGPGPEDDELIELAVDAGAVEEEIRQPIEDKVFEQWIKNATDQMSKDGVTSTPTIRIDGEDADVPQLAELLQQ